MKALGQMYLDQMFPFKRLMNVLGKYVENRFIPKGWMVQRWTQRRPMSFAHTI
jgi:hypothetical protein